MELWVFMPFWPSTPPSLVPQISREQPSGVEAEPGEVEGELLAEVGADEVERLVEEEALGIRPVVPEELAGGFLGGAAVLWLVKKERGFVYGTV